MKIEQTKLAQFYDGELANVTGRLFGALKEIERLRNALAGICSLENSGSLLGDQARWWGAKAIAEQALTQQVSR